LSNFKFLILSSKFIMWVYIFNLTFFFPRVLLQIIGMPLCFTNLHFTRNYWCYLRRFVACKSFFCPWMSLFGLRNFLGVTNYWYIWFTFKLLLMAMPFSTCSCTITLFNCLLKILVTIIFSICTHFNSNLNKLFALKQNPHS